jgi:two-component system chemotaxis sensor kinase CheA
VNTQNISFPEFMDDYFAESEEHLVSMRRLLLQMEGFVNQERIDPEFPVVMDELLGVLHSMKGLSAMVGIHDIEQLAHVMEQSIRSMKADAAPDEEAMKALVSGTEMIEQIIEARRRAIPGPDTQAALTRFTSVALTQSPTMTEAPEALESHEIAPVSLPGGGVRVDMKRLDHLMAMVGDLVISRGHMDETLRRLADVLPSSAWRDLQEDSILLQRQLRNLREGVMRMRMVPIGNTFERMRFVVRGLEQSSQKRVQLELTGETTEIDKLLVERMMDPLLQMVRNAVIHGLETPDERIASGKTAEGHLWIRARTESETVVIELEDDGRGVDIEKVMSRSRALGLLEHDDSPDAVRVLQMICIPGFSTREQADLGAGHGVGMTIVKSTVSGLAGTIAMDTRPGKGTRFTIRLPLTLAIMESLIVYVNDQPFAVPRSLIQEVLRVESHTMTTVEETEVIPWRGGVLPIVHLRRMFRMNGKPRTSFHVFVVDADSSAIGIAVDRIARQREIVARPVEDPLVHVPGIAGATELGDGRPVLILDVAAIVDAMRGHRDLAPELVAIS